MVFLFKMFGLAVLFCAFAGIGLIATALYYLIKDKLSKNDTPKDESNDRLRVAAFVSMIVGFIGLITVIAEKSGFFSH